MELLIVLQYICFAPVSLAGIVLSFDVNSSVYIWGSPTEGLIIATVSRYCHWVL